MMFSPIEIGDSALFYALVARNVTGIREKFNQFQQCSKQIQK